MSRTKEPGIVSVSQVEVPILSEGIATPAVKRTHPAQKIWCEDERRQRASYIATQRTLSPFIVPHRFEGRTKPEKLARARIGHPVALNRAYLQEILGHIRSASATYRWETLSLDPTEITGEPNGGVARVLWDDATRTGVTWKNFMEASVLEWMLTSCGGFVAVDVVPVEANSLKEQQERGKRPYLRWIPLSAVLDFGQGDTGIRWVKILEVTDERSPLGEEGMTETVLIYELMEDGTTRIQRLDSKTGKVLQEANPGRIIDRQGQSSLPLIPVFYGEHPEIPGIGSGLLMGLDDIVIDLFNTITEVRESYRDAAFGMLVHTGDQTEASDLIEKLADGSRFVNIGASKESSLQRLTAEKSEVDAGLSLIELAVKNWALSAKRKAAEADTSTARSGVSLQAEFALDLKPLLTTICEVLDSVESNTMWVVGQMSGLTVQESDAVRVIRNTEFRLEDESARIARITGEVMKVLPLPAVVKAEITKRWVESSGLMDYEQNKVVIDAQIEELFNAEHNQKVRDTFLPSLDDL